MISHEYRCIHIHIPKCAGTSIETALGHSQGEAKRVAPDHRTIRRIEAPFLTPDALSSAENAMEVLRRVRHRFRSTAHPRNRLTVNKGQYLSYFKFAFVRNPWSRAYSWYWNVMRDENHRRTLGIDDQISFGAFLECHAGKGMLRPQTYWLKSLSGAIPLDFIGKFEALDADFEICCRRMNIAPIVLPHTRKSDHNDYREAYDSRLRDLVAEVYSEEIAMFDYSF